MDKDLKNSMVGKANIYDRYAYFSFEILRSQMYLAKRINTDAEKITKEGLDVCMDELESILCEIKQLPKEDAEKLMKDSVYFGDNYIFNELNKELMNKSKDLQTEYTQENPKISKELKELFNNN